MKLFKKLFGWLANRWVISILGILILCALIWFLGPLVAIAGVEPLAGEQARLLTIIIVVLVWLLHNLIMLLRARRTNRQVLDELAGVPAGAASALSDTQLSEEEVEELRERFGEALSVLKKARLGGRRGRRFVYQLPWYLIIGPPGAGKTTALRNSGLQFPLSDRFGQHAIQGVGGTRNCDWWFTDEAVLLDTAGRYTTQDSDADIDKAGWAGFLELLKRHRRQRPLDGVLVAFSLADLAQQSPEERKQHAHAVRLRLHEVQENLKIKVPVYVIFTKCDLISGFVEYFEDLGSEGREQVWGITFALAESQQPGRAMAAFGQEFDTLMDRLDTRLIGRLEQEQDVRRRAAIHGFPPQMRSLKAALQDFLADLFAPSRFEEQALLRGVYFSSGTQEGTPIDRLITSVSSAFGLDRQAMPAFSGPGRSYFLNRLLREVVFREAELVQPVGFFNLNRAWIQWSAYASALLVLLGVGTAWFVSYTANLAHMAEVEEHIDRYEQVVAEFPEGRGNIVDVLPSLNTLREIPGGYEDRDRSVPLMMGLGLYQGDKLGTAARTAYNRALNTVLLPRLMARLEDQIRGSMTREEFLYEALKVYLMQGIANRLDREVVGLWVSLDWDNRFPGVGGEEVRAQLQAHLDSLLEGKLNLLPLDTILITQARRTIARLTLAERVYLQIKGSARAHELGQWRMTERLGEADAQYFRRLSGKSISTGIPGLFTSKGFKEVFLVEGPRLARTASDEVWILGNEFSQEIGEADVRTLSQGVARLYADDYVRQWDDFLQDVDVVRFQGFPHGIAVTKALAGGTSPIKALLIAVSRETKLITRPVGAAAVGGQLGQLDELRKKFYSLFSESAEETPELVVDNPIQAVDRRFARIHALVGAGEAGGAPIDQVVSTLGELYVLLKQHEAAGGNVDTGPIVQRIELQAEHQPMPLDRWLNTVARQTAMITVQDVRSRVNSVWTSTVAPYCRDALANRYPLVKETPQDVNLDDFGQFFGPGGRVDSFFQSYLQGHVDTSVSPWRLTRSGDLRLSSETLGQFERADRIKRAFFQGGGAQPNVRFKIKPLKLDKSASQILIELGDQRHTYRHGPQRWQEMQWPPAGGSNRVRVVFNPIGEGVASVSLTAEGPWAWFRVLDRARVERTAAPDRFTVTFEAQGMQAVYELQAGSITNPFGLREIVLFRCPERL